MYKNLSAGCVVMVKKMKFEKLKKKWENYKIYKRKEKRPTIVL